MDYAVTVYPCYELITHTYAYMTSTRIFQGSFRNKDKHKKYVRWHECMLFEVMDTARLCRVLKAASVYNNTYFSWSVGKNTEKYTRQKMTNRQGKPTYFERNQS
jgi:hypothetical protein